MKKSLLLMALATLSSTTLWAQVALQPATGASAQPLDSAQQDSIKTKPQKMDDLFKAADKNGDGKLTKEEAKAAGLTRIVDHFDEIDKNKDGKISATEHDAIRSAAPTQTQSYQQGGKK